MKILAVVCLLLAFSALPSQTQGTGRRNVKAVAGRLSDPQAHPPRTVWERMRDPRGWWQGRLAGINPQGVSPQARAQSLAALPRMGGAIANPIFLIPPTFDSGGRSTSQVETGDFNGDGKADLLVSNQCANSDCTQGSIAVLLGNGDGTYQAALVTPTGAAQSAMAVGDFNRDGKLDVAVNDECSDVGCTSGSVHVLLGNGNGTFQAAVAYPTGGDAFSIQAGDVNGDSKLDLVVATGSTSAGILLGNGDGTFQAATSVTTGTTGQTGVFLGDFNNDSKLDLAAVTSACDTSQCTTLVSVLPGNGNGTFQPAGASQSFAGMNAEAVALGDVTSDGNLDLAVLEDCVPQTSTCVNDSVNLLLGKGDGTFSGSKNSALVQNGASFVGLGDLNGDGKLDLVTDPGGVSAVMLGIGDGTFRFLGSYSTEGLSPTSVALTDLNGDGKVDLAISNSCQLFSSSQPCEGGAIALMGNGDGTFAGPVTYPTLGRVPVAVAADFNQDGAPDIVLVGVCRTLDCTGTSTADVWLGNPNATLQLPVSYDVGGNPQSLATGDFNGDGKPDLVVANSCASPQDCTRDGAGVLLGNGDGTFKPVVLSPSVGAGPQAVATGDFNGDGKLDVAIAETCSDINHCFDGSNGAVSVLMGNGDGSFARSVSYSSGQPIARAVAVGDFNGDGKLDLAVANGNCSPGEEEPLCQAGSVAVLLGNGDGSFQAAVLYSSTDDDAFAVVTGDFNKDGKLDLAVANTNCQFYFGCLDGTIAVLLGNGDGTFVTATTYDAGNSWPGDINNTRSSSVVAEDFNGDGNLDLALGNRNVLVGNGDGTFQAPQDYNPAEDPGFSVAVADFNSDGKPDLAVTGDAGLTLLLNSSVGFLHATSTSLTSSRNPVNFHHHVTFTATVTSTSSGTPTGTVTFSDGGHALASESVVNGKAKFSTDALDAGLHKITASYSGDQSFLSSTSPELDQAVRAETRVKLTSSDNPSRHGEAVTFTAVVEANSGATPTGNVTFRDFFLTLGTVTLNGGQATFTTSHLRRGHHVIRADYGGSKLDEHSSAAIRQHVR